jgi:hypothetical protein
MQIVELQMWWVVVGWGAAEGGHVSESISLAWAEPIPGRTRMTDYSYLLNK